MGRGAAWSFDSIMFCWPCQISMTGRVFCTSGTAWPPSRAADMRNGEPPTGSFRSATPTWSWSRSSTTTGRWPIISGVGSRALGRASFSHSDGRFARHRSTMSRSGSTLSSAADHDWHRMAESFSGGWRVSSGPRPSHHTPSSSSGRTRDATSEPDADDSSRGNGCGGPRGGGRRQHSTGELAWRQSTSRCHLVWTVDAPTSTPAQLHPRHRSRGRALGVQTADLALRTKKALSRHGFTTAS